MAGPLLSIDADQQTSAVEKTTPQNDRWRAEQIEPRRGGPFTLLVVADGEGQTAPGAAADLAVEIAVAEAKLRRDDPLPRLLKHLLTQMNEVIFRHGPGRLVGVTIAAIHGDNVWLAQAGSQTRCYRVRGERAAMQLSVDNENTLGRSGTVPVPAVTTHKLKRGDKLVFCSDGLYAKELVNPRDIAKIDRYRDVKGTARHLSALAMGRNVSDNVTVVVAAYGRKSAFTLKVLIYDALGVTAAILLVILLGSVLRDTLRLLPRPPDLGVAVLAEGNAIEVEQLQVIYPGSVLSAAPKSPIQLSLKRRESVDSALTQTIPNVSLYFDEGSQINLAAIDVQGFTDLGKGLKDPTNLTEIYLLKGRALILNQSPRTFYVWLGEPGEEGSPLIILQGEHAALGVEQTGNRVTAYCLYGSCVIHLGANSAGIAASGKSTFSIDSLDIARIGATPLEEQDWNAWLSLCSTWQTDLDNITGVCRSLIP
jgi:serine/threonine protein phosphatase PrpC